MMEESKIELWANHDHLKILATDAFEFPRDITRLITFLNRNLKKRGLIFGLKRQGTKYYLNIYDSDGHD